MTMSSLKAALEAERLRLWRQAVNDHPRMTPASAEIFEKEIEKKLKTFVKDFRPTDPKKHSQQFDFDFLQDHPVGRRFKNSRSSR